jgi:hypothetical protein
MRTLFRLSAVLFAVAACSPPPPPPPIAVVPHSVQPIQPSPLAAMTPSEAGPVSLLPRGRTHEPTVAHHKPRTKRPIVIAQANAAGGRGQAVQSTFPSYVKTLSGDDLWHRLRIQFPFHLQTVGLSEPDRQGDRILIIAEPPPTLPRGEFSEGLREIFGETLREAHLMRQPIGYDGWVEDIVATLHYPEGGTGNER